MLVSPAMCRRAKDQKSRPGSAAENSDMEDSRIPFGEFAGCLRGATGERITFDSSMSRVAKLRYFCDPAAKCELHAKACEASTLQIEACRATSKRWWITK